MDFRASTKGFARTIKYNLTFLYGEKTNTAFFDRRLVAADSEFPLKVGRSTDIRCERNAGTLFLCKSAFRSKGTVAKRCSKETKKKSACFM